MRRRADGDHSAQMIRVVAIERTGASDGVIEEVASECSGYDRL